MRKPTKMQLKLYKKDKIFINQQNEYNVIKLIFTNVSFQLWIVYFIIKITVY